jgi:hypothetical protein
VFLGDNLLPLLTLALGGAMAVGTILAVVRPRAEDRDGELIRPPLVRSGVMIAIGLVASVWAFASLVSG